MENDNVYFESITLVNDILVDRQIYSPDQKFEVVDKVAEAMGMSRYDAIRYMINLKVARLNNLDSTNAEDTLIDIAGYAVMALQSIIDNKRSK